MKENEHLPVFGIGPYMMGTIVLVSAILILLSFYHIIPNYPANPIMMGVIGVILIILGALFWLSAVLNSRITQKVEENQLVTTGIYGIVRHPIYAAFLYAVTEFIFIANNLILLILPPIYLLIVREVMIRTEEKWLSELYGEDYLNYSKNVKRFIPKVI